MDKFRKRIIALFLFSTLCFAGAIYLLHINSKNKDTVMTWDTADDSSNKAVNVSEPKNLKATHSAALDSLLQQYGTVGASVAVIENGRVAYHYEYGIADKGSGREITSDTKFRVASISKPVLAMAYMKLCDEQLLTLDTSLGDIFELDSQRGSITMRSLLSHTGGINDTKAEVNGLLLDKLSDEIKLDGLFESTARDKWQYSNLGYDMVGASVEIASGQLFQDYTKEKIFAPMGIDASWDGSYISDSRLISSCYRATGEESFSGEDLAKALPQYSPGENYKFMTGGLMISAVDLAKVFTVLINDGKYYESQILSGETVDEMHAIQISNTESNFSQCIAMRYNKNCYRGRSMYFHPGTAYGVLSLAAYDLSDGSGVIIITNGADSERDEFSNFEVCSDVLDFIYQNIIEK